MLGYWNANDETYKCTHIIGKINCNYIPNQVNCEFTTCVWDPATSKCNVKNIKNMNKFSMSLRIIAVHPVIYCLKKPVDTMMGVK